MRIAVLLAQITNMSGKSLRDGKSMSPEDFLGGSQRAQSMEEQIEMFKKMSNK